MFYDSKDIEESLRCAYCSSKLADVVKLIPECGSSICGRCCSNLEWSLSGKNQFKCKICNDKWHLMPSQGLPDNLLVVKLLRVKPVSDKTKRVRAMVDELQERVDQLEAFNPAVEAEIYCEELENQVIIRTESAMKRLNRLQEGLLKAIAEYRLRLVASGEAASKNPESRKELSRLAQAISEFKQEQMSALKQLTKDRSVDIVRIQQQTSEYIQALADLESKMREQAFEGGYLVFKVNRLFGLSTNSLGKLAYSTHAALKAETEQKVELKPLKVLVGHSLKVNQILFLSNNQIVSCSMENEIRVWDHLSGKVAYELDGHDDGVNCLALLPNGYLASGSADRTIIIWELRRQVFAEEDEEGEENEATWGLRSEGSIQQSPKKTLMGHTSAVVALKTLPNGNLASCSVDQRINIWNPYLSPTDLDNSSLLLTINSPESGDFLTPRHALLEALSNGNLVSCANEPGLETILRVWDTTDGTLLRTVTIQSKDARSLLALENDNLAIGFADGSVKLVDFLDEEELRETILGKARIVGLASLPGGVFLSADDSESGHLALLSSENCQLLHSAPCHTKQISALSTSKDGALVAVAGSTNNIEIFELVRY